jgi:hypothetical protein
VLAGKGVIAWQRDGIDNARPICAAVPGHTLDEQVGQLLVTTLTPLAVEAALQVAAELEQRADTDAGRRPRRARPLPRRPRPPPLPGRRVLKADHMPPVPLVGERELDSLRQVHVCHGRMHARLCGIKQIRHHASIMP